MRLKNVNTYKTAFGNHDFRLNINYQNISNLSIFLKYCIDTALMTVSNDYSQQFPPQLQILNTHTPLLFKDRDDACVNILV